MRFAASSRVQRASLVAAVGLGLLSVTGCSYINQQTTTMQYSPSDGVRSDIGNIELRNMIVVSNGKDQPGRVIGAIFNTAATDSTVTISGAAGSQTQVQVKAKSSSYLTMDSNASVLSTVTGLPGTLENLKFTVQGGGSTELKVPVMDGSLQEYKQYIPTPSPSSMPGASTSGGASESSTASETSSATATP